MIPNKETYTYDVRFEGRCRGMGGRGKVKNELLIDVGGEVRGWGGSCVLWTSSLYFFY